LVQVCIPNDDNIIDWGGGEWRAFQELESNTPNDSDIIRITGGREGRYKN
jgi:hypothetical protein